MVDLVRNKAYYFEGPQGIDVVEKEIPDKVKEMVKEKKQELIEALAEIDEEIEEHFLNENFDIEESVLKAAIRRNVIANKFAPVLMGSAYKNKGI